MGGLFYIHTYLHLHHNTSQQFLAPKSYFYIGYSDVFAYKNESIDSSCGDNNQSQMQIQPQNSSQSIQTTKTVHKQLIINPKLRTVIEQTIQKSAVKSEIISLHKKVFLTKQSEIYRQKVQKIKSTLQQLYPDIPVRSIIIQLYKFVLAKYEVGPRDKNLRALEVPQLYQRPSRDRRIFSKKTGKSQANWSYDYLQKHKMPPFFVRNWLAYHPVTSPFFDSVILNLPETQGDEYWRFQERRMMADAYTSVDYGVNIYRNWLNDPKCMSKDRYKSTISTVVKNSIRSIQEFLTQKAHRTITPLRVLTSRFIPNPLLNVRKYFEPELTATFLRCVRLNYCLQTEAALEQDVFVFYEQYTRIMMQQFSKKTDFNSEEDDRIRVKVSIQQREVWNEELDRYVIARYAEGCPIAAIRRQLQLSYPADVYLRCFDRMKLRYRMFKIFRASIRKMNQLMIDLGVSQEDIIGTEAEIKKLMRSPPGYRLRMKLCQLFLDENQSNQFVLQFHQDLINYRHGIYQQVRDERSSQLAWNQRMYRGEYQPHREDGVTEAGCSEQDFLQEDILNSNEDQIDQQCDYLDLSQL